METGKWVWNYFQLHSKSEVSFGWYLSSIEKKKEKQNYISTLRFFNKKCLDQEKTLPLPTMSSIYFYVCACMCSNVHGYSCMYVYRCVDIRNHSLLYLLKQSSVTSQLALGIPPVPPKCWDFRWTATPNWLLCGFWISDSGPHTGAASQLPAQF